MSKNLTRKGIAFGALVALAATAISGAPASADANGPISLLPNAGTTFTSIIGSAATLDAAIDATYMDEAGAAIYVISNPGKATLSLDLSAAATVPGFYTFDADGVARTLTTTDYAADTDVATSKAAGKEYVDYTAYASGTVDFETNSPKIAIKAGIEDTTDVINSLTIATTGTSAVALTVQVIADTSSTVLAGANGFDRASKAETVNFLPISAVSATTKITKLKRDAGASNFTAEVVYNNSVNPYWVAAKTGTKLFKDGVAVEFADDETDTAKHTAAPYDQNIVPTSIYSVAQTSGSGATLTEAAAGVLTAGVKGVASSDAPSAFNLNAAKDNVVDFPAGVYAAQAYYNTTGTTWVAVGAASVVADLSNGQDADVTAIDGYLTADKNTAFASNAATVRSTVKTATLVAQAQKAGPLSLEASNIQVKATFTADKLSATSATTISGAATGLAKTGDSVVAYGRTDSKGLVNFAISNAGAVAGDKLTAVIGVLKADGTWTAAETVTVTWAAADLKSFEAKPGAYVSGANPTVTFVTKDQFGEPIDFDSDASLSVTAVASIAGISKPATFSKTTAVSAGKAVFTFANFAAAGASAQLIATLKAGSADATPTTGSASITVNIYNALGTDKIAVVDSFEKAITYKDFVTGDSTDAAVAAKLTKVGYASADFQTITGTVTNVNGSGQPGIAVEVSGSGLLFKSGEIYATDKITAYANEYGVFTVDVFAHVVNVKGIKVSFAADGKTASTLLKTKLPTSITDANLAFSWNLPALLVKNTTYAVTAKLADKWGNPIAADDAVPASLGTDFAVYFQGTGSVEVNSTTAVSKNFDKSGSVTVFVRSVKDIAGPGSLSATLGTAWVYPTTLVGGKTASGTIDAYETVDDTATAWNETLWSNELTANLEILDKKPTASIVKAATSKVVVKNANGTTIKVVRGSKVVTKVATSNSQKITLKGGKGTVKVYVNGVKVASK